MLILEVMMFIGLLLVASPWLFLLIGLIRFVVDDFTERNYDFIPIALLGIGLWFIATSLFVYIAIR